jgi:hypothetical protein
MPAPMRRAVGETIGSGRILHLDLNHAHLIRTPLGVRVWVVEGRGVTCVIRDRTATSTCVTTVNARKRGLLLEVYKPSEQPKGLPSHFLALGITPNWARSVLVSIGPTRKAIPIDQHLYALRAEEPVEVKRLLR